MTFLHPRIPEVEEDSGHPKGGKVSLPLSPCTQQIVKVGWWKQTSFGRELLKIGLHLMVSLPWTWELMELFLSLILGRHFSRSMWA